ncbi:MAG: hypothetical protein FWG66_04680 [Spirochaetes bacterium]|nr:hypothetical protein [Spirochaetota bacterium]
MESLVPNWVLKLDDVENKTVKEIFKKRKKPYTEDAMIEILKSQTSKTDIYWAILALREVGTVESIEYLKNIVLYKNMDIQATSVLTIAKLANGTENEFLGKLLLEKEFKQKWYAMVAIFYKPDKKPLPYVLEYGVKTIKNCKNMNDAGELIITYLARYAPENEQSQKIFAKVNKDFENLSPFGQKCLREEFPKIFK